MIPTQEEIDQMIEAINRYNNATTIEERFGALNSLMNKRERLLIKNDKNADRSEEF